MMLRRLTTLYLLLCVVAAPAIAQTPEREFARAEAAWDKDDYAGAETYFERALRVADSGTGDEAHAYFGRGLARLQQEKWRGARRFDRFGCSGARQRRGVRFARDGA